MWIIGYGSLMDKEQFKGQNYQLVTVKGWKRLYNKLVSRKKWKKFAHENYQGTVNVEKDLDTEFNAVAFEVDEQGFEDLKNREEDYHAQEVTVCEFGSSKEFENAVLFVSNKTDQSGEIRSSDQLLPIPEYLEVCRKGAYSWGDKFGKVFDQTTYLADGKTSIKEYLLNK